MNLDFVEIICHTFDFWFKSWNLMLWAINFMWINTVNTDRYAVDLILTMTMLMFTACLTFLLDAVPIVYRIKRIFIIVATVLLFMIILSAYFTYDDILYNPFEAYKFKYTEISLKSTFLGSYSNILLFVAKPLFGDIFRWIAANYKCKDHKTQDEGDKTRDIAIGDTYERLFTVYKRPKVAWEDPVTKPMF